MIPDNRRPDVRIAAVVVMFQPQESLISNVMTYLPDVGVLYVWDNSPGESKSVVQETTRLPRAMYLTEGKNVGVARALNVAAGKACGAGYKYLLTMDQDSAASNDMIQMMLADAGEDPLIGLISPFHLDRNAPLPPPGRGVEVVDAAMTSGNLVNLEAHRKIGGFMDELFIDYVDTEYCLRLRANGFRVVRVNRAILSHAEGHYTPRSFFGITVYPTNQIPERLYYRARNRLCVTRRYRDRFPEFVKFMDKMYWRTLIKMLLYEKRRPAKLFMVCRGFLAYWLGDFSSGPLK